MQHLLRDRRLPKIMESVLKGPQIDLLTSQKKPDTHREIRHSNPLQKDTL